jgi:hypothetical protein
VKVDRHWQSKATPRAGIRELLNDPTETPLAEIQEQLGEVVIYGYKVTGNFRHTPVVAEVSINCR